MTPKFLPRIKHLLCAAAVVCAAALVGCVAIFPHKPAERAADRLLDDIFAGTEAPAPVNTARVPARVDAATTPQAFVGGSIGSKDNAAKSPSK